MQFLARSLSKSIRPSLNSTARQSWVFSQQCHSTFSAESSTHGGGSRAEESSEEWPRPTEVPYQPKIANSIDLIGYIHQPVQFDSTIDGNFWAGTVISHEPSSDSKSVSDSSSNFWIPVLFEGDLAHTANCYLKKNDRVHISGQILGDVIQSGANSDQAYVQLFKSFHGSFSHQVMVRDLHYIEDSTALPKVLPTSDQNEGVLKHSASVQKGRDFRTNLWFDLVNKPDEWFDHRESKQNRSVNPRHPDFKKKDGSAALWLSKAPKEILSELKDVKFDIPKYAKKPKAGEESWKDLVENRNKWWDNRLNKKNPKAPDFKHRDTGVGLWLGNSPSWVLEKLPPPKKKDESAALWLSTAPKEILSELKDMKSDIPKYAKQPKAGEESWKDLVENMNKWWDNRLDKRNPKAPDFKHKETGVGLWLGNSPSWVLEKLPPPKNKTSDIYEEPEMF